MATSEASIYPSKAALRNTELRKSQHQAVQTAITPDPNPELNCLWGHMGLLTSVKEAPVFRRHLATPSYSAYSESISGFTINVHTYIPTLSNVMMHNRFELIESTIHNLKPSVGRRL